jgi:hypothetical protein
MSGNGRAEGAIALDIGFDAASRPDRGPICDIGVICG